MKKILTALFLSSVFLLSCGSDEENDPGCNVDVLGYTGSVTLNGDPICYQKGGLGFNSASNILSLSLFSPRGTTGEEIDVLFSVPPQGFQFNQAYAVTSGEYSNAVPVKGGTIILTKDNFPEDPNLLQYKGTIDLIFQSAGSGTEINVSGTFSFEQP